MSARPTLALLIAVAACSDAAAPAYEVALESNGSATLGSAFVVRGGTAFRLPPQPTRLVLAAIQFLSNGDDPPNSFGGGGVSLELSRGLPRTGSTRLARQWLGTCDDRPSRPCWTGPVFDPPAIIEAGAQDVFVGIDRIGGEGGTFTLPIAGDAAGLHKLESWGHGSVSWGPDSSLASPPEWTRAPADQPWIFRLLVQP